MTRLTAIATILPLLGLLAAGCNSPSKPASDAKPGDEPGAATTEAPKKDGTALVKIGDSSITIEEFRDNLMKQSPFLRARYNTLDKKEQFLDNMIRFELLAREARRRGLDQDPDVQDTMKKVMVQKLVREINENGSDEIPEEELRAYYESHLTDYVKPERVRVSHIFFAADKSDAAAAKKARRSATQRLNEIRKKKEDQMAFQAMAREVSEDVASRSVGGDLKYLTKEELGSAWGPSVADAAFALEKVGDLAEVVEGEKGFHLLKLTGRQKALDRTFEQVKRQIQGRVQREKRTSSFDDFVASLEQKEGVEIDKALLDKVEVAASGVALPGETLPPPGAETSGTPAGMPIPRPPAPGMAGQTPPPPPNTARPAGSVPPPPPGQPNPHATPTAPATKSTE